MTNDPANIAAALRSFALYAICATLAIIIGVLMTDPLTYSTLGFVGIVCAILFMPLLLRWHHPLMIFAWNTPIMMFFIKGDPDLCLVMIALSLAISVTERALNQTHFIKAPQVAGPLIALIGIVAITAKLDGGIGLRAFGSDVYGGKKYIFLIVGILGYFALTARPIPPQKAQKYVAYFCLGGALSCVRDFYPLVPHFLTPIFWLIPPLSLDTGLQLGTTRLVGTGWAATAVVAFLIARYGLRGIFLSGKLWRPIVFFISIILIFFGGFRSALVTTGALIILQFFFEGMHRTKLMPFFIILLVGASVAAIPLASKLPFTFQRTLAVFPEGWVHLSSDARLAAEDSTNWRIDMWKSLIPQIPKYLLLGKGYTITMEDYAQIASLGAIQSADAGQQDLALSSDYHNGPLSVILPFGIWGALAFLWFTGASLWVMYRNFRYSDPALQATNTFLFSSYIVTTLSFYFIAGGLADGTAAFTGLLGLSVSINRGVRRAPVASAANIPFKVRFAGVRARPQPAFQRRLAGGP
jgi:hypothetical protein